MRKPHNRLKLLAWSLLLAVCFTISTQAEEGEEPESPAERYLREKTERLWAELDPRLQQVLERVDETKEEFTAVRADVRYERRITLLDIRRQARGKLVFKTPDKIILTLGEPRNEDVYCNGDTWWVVDHDDKSVEVYDSTRKTMANTEAAFLDFGYGRGPKRLLQNYTIELADVEQGKPEDDEGPETLYRVIFRPREHLQIEHRYMAVEVLISDRHWLPRQFVLRERGGEVVHTYALSNMELNPDVEEEQFVFEPPRHYTVLRPGSR